MELLLTIRLLGNHDLSVDPAYSLNYENGWKVTPDRVEECRELLKSAPGIIYLEHSSANIQLFERDISFRVFGSPYSPDRSEENWAFQYSEVNADELWGAIPADTDVLITHTPPARHCDASEHWRKGGCPSLTKALWNVKPALHICGHCHEGRGAQVVHWGEDIDTSEIVQTWEDPGVGSKKQSLLDLTGCRSGHVLDPGSETAIINASVMAKSWGKGSKLFNKPIVVDVET